MRVPGFLATILCILALGCLAADAATPKKSGKSSAPRQRTAESIKKERSATERKISETSSRITTTGNELKRQLNTLNSLNVDIREQETTITMLRTRLDSIGTAITVTTDSIAVLENQLERMRQAYAGALRQLQPSAGDMNAFSFIFSSDSFIEAYSRLRYLNRFSEWRQKKAADIDQAIERVAQRRQHLTGLRHSQDKAFRQADDARRQLAQKQDESRRLVSDLRKQDSKLRAQLNEQKRQASALDRELDRIIAAEQERIAREEAAKRKAAGNANGKKPAPSSGTSSSGGGGGASAASSSEVQTAAATEASALTGSFESNKGRLLFPVNGRYKVVREFGRHPHPTQKHVITDNSGIDVEVAQGSKARAVFDGTVSAIFRQDGFHNIVMIRHGRYITIYAGLADTSVSQGQKIKAGQTVGTVFSDPADSGRSILHFEVRDERRKLNPSLWVK